MIKLPKLSSTLILIVLPFVWFVLLSYGLIIALFVNLNKDTKDNYLALENQIYNIFQAKPPAFGETSYAVQSEESRPIILEQFFAKYHSPLSSYSRLIIKKSKEYNLPWLLIPAIAGQESTFCRAGSFPTDSYNCWGWAIHSSYTKYFNSYEEAIETVAKGINDFYRRLNIDPTWPVSDQVLAMRRLYNTASPAWASGVLYFVDELDNFATTSN